MTDTFAREITYARISLTGCCNLRCRYCMPRGGVPQPHDCLSDDEVLALVRGLAAAGVRKVRFTGGEATVRPDDASPARATYAGTPGIETWALTTNALTLGRDAVHLRDAGIQRVNISLDTLDAQAYRTLTGGDLAAALAGLEAALAAGFARVKLNAVLIRGVSEVQIPRLAALTRQHPLDVRFIELMPPAVPGLGRGAFPVCIRSPGCAARPAAGCARTSCTGYLLPPAGRTGPHWPDNTDEL